MNVMKRTMLVGLATTLLWGFVYAETPSEGERLTQEVRATLKKWNKATADEAETAAKAFLILHDRLKVDTSLSEKDRVRMMGIVRKKLTVLSRQIEKNVKDAPKSVKEANEKPPVLAQQQPNGGGTTDRGFQLSQANGEVLVGIIQDTIRPDSWEERGGNGTIRYWNNKQFLIIRQTDPAHEEIDGLLEQLRRAGG